MSVGVFGERPSPSRGPLSSWGVGVGASDVLDRELCHDGEAPQESGLPQSHSNADTPMETRCSWRSAHPTSQIPVMCQSATFSTAVGRLDA